MAARLRPSHDEPRTRLKHVGLLTTERVAILDTLREVPGISLSELSRRIGRHPATVDTHVHVLQQAGLVVKERVGRRVALHAVGFGPSARERLVARVGTTGAQLLDILQAERVASVAELADALGITRHRARSQLRRLERFGLVRGVETRVLVTRTRYVSVIE